MSLTRVETIKECRAAVAQARSSGSIGFVPTMGALHDGHLALVDKAGQLADTVVVSIFVNPAQFGPKEDFGAYPRDLDRDLDLLAERDVDVVFTPSTGDLYPAPSLTTVTVRRIADGFEGLARPSHFEGVLLVVCKLLNIVQPDIAIFGQKDAQQAAVVRRMLADLDFPVELVVCPTVREADGLACSSRNVYLGAEERRQALAIHRALRAALELVQSGEVSVAQVEATMLNELEREATIEVEYAAVVDSDCFEPRAKIEGPCLAAIAARVGKTRLIDNMILSES